jgi:hypothetical protein
MALSIPDSAGIVINVGNVMAKTLAEIKSPNVHDIERIDIDGRTLLLNLLRVSAAKERLAESIDVSLLGVWADTSELSFINTKTGEMVRGVVIRKLSDVEYEYSKDYELPVSVQIWNRFNPLHSIVFPTKIIAEINFKALREAAVLSQSLGSLFVLAVELSHRSRNSGDKVIQ